MDLVTLAAAKKYTKDSLVGAGALVGKNVTISSITAIEGGNRITFSYTDDEDETHTETLDVMDGKDGNDGVSPTVSVTDITGGKRITFSYTDDNDETHTETLDVKDAIDGTDGVSPTVTKTNITGGVRVSFTDATQTISVDIPIQPDIFDEKMVLFMGDSFMEGFGARAADGLETAQNPITSPATADSTAMRGWAKKFKENHPGANVHNLGIYGATIAFQDNAPSFMGELVYMFNNNWQPDYVVFDGGANDVFQGITSGSATADDAYAVMDWDTFNYNTYQTIPCLEAIFSLFQSNSPTTRLLFISPPPMDITVTSEMATAIENMKTAVEAVCDKWGVAHIQLLDKGSKNTVYGSNTDYYASADKIHPLQRYYDETIGQIEEALKNY